MQQRPPAHVLPAMFMLSDAIPPGISAVSASAVQQCVHVYEGCVRATCLCAHTTYGVRTPDGVSSCAHTTSGVRTPNGVSGVSDDVSAPRGSCSNSDRSAPRGCCSNSDRSAPTGSYSNRSAPRGSCSNSDRSTPRGCCNNSDRSAPTGSCSNSDRSAPTGSYSVMATHMHKKLIGIALQKVHLVQDLLKIIAYEDEHGNITEQSKKWIVQLNDLLLPWIRFLAEATTGKWQSLLCKYKALAKQDTSQHNIYVRFNLLNGAS